MTYSFYQTQQTLRAYHAPSSLASLGLNLFRLNKQTAFAFMISLKGKVPVWRLFPKRRAFASTTTLLELPI
jgi:hypothetical protein